MTGEGIEKELHGIQEVDGSIPFSSTFLFNDLPVS